MAGTAASIGPHDVASDPGQLGPERGHGPLPSRGDRRNAHWERQVHAVACLLGSKGMMTTDEMRRCIEQLEPGVYKSAPYYEKWAIATATALLERGSLTNGELEAALGPADEGEPAEPFAAGAVVRVRRASHAARWRRPHLRTPGFVHGVCGTVERHVGSFPNPEQLAFGGASRGHQHLYTVRFGRRSIFDFDLDAPTGSAGGADDDAADDVVTVEVYHSWLEPATQEDLRAQGRGSAARAQGPAGAGGPAAGPDCKRPRTGALHGGHAHDEDRLAVEQRAADAEIPCPPIARALVAVLTAKGTISGEELRAEVEKMETMETSLGERGRQVVARAWADEGFRRRLLQDANAACAELGIQASNANTPTRLVVVEQTPGEHHLICCTLCSCYPLSLLGPSPDWYKSREYRARAVREPRAVLREFGTELPGHVRVVVHDSTADCRYLVLPRRPPGTEGWPEERLRELVSRDSMLGVAVPGAAH